MLYVCILYACGGVLRYVEESDFTLKNVIVWVKNNWTAGDLKASFGRQYELLLLLNKGRAAINGNRISDVWKFDKITGKHQLHQNQKPVDLLEQAIVKHSNVNDLILDPFAGSGSTAIACMNTKRQFIGCELDRGYYDIAYKRIEQYKLIGGINGP